MLGTAGLVMLAVPGALGQQVPTGPGDVQAIPRLSIRADDDPTRRMDLMPGTFAGGFEQDVLGLTLTPIEPALRAQLDLSEGEGLMVQEVAPESPASAAGLQKNDLVLTIDNRPVRSIDDVRRRIEAAPDSAKDLEIQYIRGGKRERVRVAFPARAAGPPAARSDADRESAEGPEFWIGGAIRPGSAALRSHLDIPEGQGLVVEEVVPDSPAARAGLKENDILLSLDDQPLDSIESLMKRVSEAGKKEVTLQVLRTSQTQEIRVTPEERKPGGPQPRLRNRPDRFPFLGPGIMIEPDGEGPIRMHILPGGPIPPGFPSPPIILPPNPFAGGPSASFDKRLQEMNDQLQELRQAVEDLRKEFLKRMNTPPYESQP